MYDRSITDAARTAFGPKRPPTRYVTPVSKGTPTYQPGGHQGGRALRVGEELVGQEVTGFLGQHATWVLEFFYSSATPGKEPELLAGLMDTKGTVVKGV